MAGNEGGQKGAVLRHVTAGIVVKLAVLYHDIGLS